MFLQKYNGMIVSVLLLSACTRDGDADPANAVQVAEGKEVYATQCARCHGAKLEGQPNWRTRSAEGKLPAPPHDDTGHTWHHADKLLFGIVKHGMVPPYGPEGYQSDMPAFGQHLSDEEIWSVLAFIKSTWPDQARQAQANIDKQAK